MINPVNNAYGPAYGQSANENAKNRDKKAIQNDTAYILEISGNKDNVDKSKGLSGDAVERLKSEAGKPLAALKDVVEKLILRQTGRSVSININIEITGIIGSDTMTQAEAAEAVSETGEWGVEAVSDRIVSFAKSLSGGDSGKLELLRGAIEKGFTNAKKALGGNLPDISSKTYDAVMEKLDSWAAESTSPEAAHK